MHDEDLDAVLWSDVPVYWAQGVLAERLGVTVEEADQALRAHADRTGRPLLEVAGDVVGFRLLLDPHADS
jgi:AmiR/NasT family two-component response regulator